MYHDYKEVKFQKKFNSTKKNRCLDIKKLKKS